MNYAEALAHPEVFGRWFGGSSWAPWRVLEKALFGLALEPAELPLFQELTGRDQAPDRQVTEAWIIAGRRSAKSRKAATIGVYIATLRAAGISAQELAQEAETLLARFPNASVNADEHRRLRAALYRPLLGLEKEDRGRVVDLVLAILLDEGSHAGA